MARLFFSYSHKDEELRNELEVHLALLRRQGFITAWHDRRIQAGTDFGKSIDNELENSNIILLLISPYFLASDYCYNNEMKRALEQHDQNSAIVVPVILHPCDWHSAPFGHLLATPTDGKPISTFANQHEAFTDVARHIRELVSSTQPEESDAGAVVSDLYSPPTVRSSNLRVKKKFDDHEKDIFLENSFEYIRRYFEGSLNELEQRNDHIKTRFFRNGDTNFSAIVYDQGKKVSECNIGYAQEGLFSAGITFSFTSTQQSNQFNESLSIYDDGYTLQLKPLGMQLSVSYGSEALSQEGAAELYWSMLISRLQ
jgi:hypothetical protein